jgi:hypothetical protein
MRAVDEQALQDSIAHWKRLVEATPSLNAWEVPGAADCPLCCYYWNVPNKKTCDGCPIFEYTGHRLCNDTPYPEAHEIWENYAMGFDTYTIEEWRRAAQAMVDFLQNLLQTLKGSGSDENRLSI